MKIPLRVYLRHWWQIWDSEIAYTVRIMFVILLAYGLVGSLEFADEKAQEAERHQTTQKATELAFVKCLNGGWVAQTETHAIVCSKAYEVSK